VLAGKAIGPPPESAARLRSPVFEDELAVKQAIVAKTPVADFTLEHEVRLASPEANGGLTFRGTKAADGSLQGYREVAGAELWGPLLEDGRRGVVQRPHNEIWQTLADLQRLRDPQRPHPRRGASAAEVSAWGFAA